MLSRSSDKGSKAPVIASTSKYRKKFKQLVAEAEMSMSRRMAILIKKDIEYWETTGEVLDWEKLDIEAIQRHCQVNESATTNGNHPKQVKVTKPRKHHKTYKDKVGELLTELAGNHVKVSFDGEEKAFYSDELELVETE